MKKRIDPFGNDSTPISPLPIRGTGLKNNNADERRGGIPRTEDERIVRHKEILDDSSDKSNFVREEKEGMVVFTNKKHLGAEIPAPIERKRRTEMEKNWEKNKDKYYFKK